MTYAIDIKKDLLHFGLDHLEIYWTFKDEALFTILDFENFTWSIDEYTIEKRKVDRFTYKIIFKKDNHSLFAYYKWRPKWEGQNIWTRDYLVVYSTTFKLMEYEEISYFIENYMTFDKLRRFDICADLMFDTTTLLKDYFEEYKTWNELRNAWETGTRYYWRKSMSKNKRKLVRTYDKLKDTKDKWKHELYKDYLIHDSVTRVELEIRQELAKNMKYEDIYDDVFLMWLFKNYLWRYTEIFNDLPSEKITLYKKPNVEFDPESYQSLFYKHQRRNLFLGHAKTIYNLWFCPVRVLILEWYIQDKTKMVLWVDKVGSLLDLERIVKDDMYIRKNFASIMNELYGRGL